MVNKKRLLIIANRLPVRFERTQDRYEMVQSEGGLATGLASLDSDLKKEWIGWPGIYTQSRTEQQTIESSMDPSYHPVFLSRREVDMYYEGFSNETLWPLFHYFMSYTTYSARQWEYYKAVNEKFCEKIASVAREGDIIWIQDYHLLLLPAMLREKLGSKNPIGFFLHIPFPSYELFRTLPWRKDLLEGMMGADLIGFHTFEYMRHFINTVYRISGYESKSGTINVKGRAVLVDSFPMGICFNKFHEASNNPTVVQQLENFKGKFGNVKLILSVDRLDYTKGILNRLKAFDNLLIRNPGLKGKVSLIMLTVPSRDGVREYQKLKVEVDKMVGNINGKHSSLTWTPIHYLYRSVSFEELVALYNLADIGLVTPLRDGMNLVAKEYVASKNHGNGVLILSEMAGAAIELNDALRINPNNQDELTGAMYQALHMDEGEQQKRLKKMQEHIQLNSVEKWGADFINELNAVYDKSKRNECMIINGKETAAICEGFMDADERLIILDYDGTLIPFYDNPHDAKPDPQLKKLICELSRYATVVLLSGRDHFTMEEWLGDCNIPLIAEHGIWIKEQKAWKQVRELSSAWKADIYPLMQGIVEKTPGSFIEEKPFSLVFHYRRSDSWLSEVRVPQLISLLAPVCNIKNLNILDGHKVIEVRLPGIDKGSASHKFLLQKQWDFIMAIGDDKTDEDMFAVMPEHAYTIKVGMHESKARLKIRNHEKVRELLNSILSHAQTYSKIHSLLKAAV